MNVNNAEVAPADDEEGWSEVVTPAPTKKEFLHKMGVIERRLMGQAERAYSEEPVSRPFVTPIARASNTTQRINALVEQIQALGHSGPDQDKLLNTVRRLLCQLRKEIVEADAETIALMVEKTTAEMEVRYDQLTGLPTLREAIKRFTRQVAHCQANNEPFAVTFIDGNKFGEVNKTDGVGQDRCDTLIRLIASSLNKSIRHNRPEEDEIATINQHVIGRRSGGDEQSTGHCLGKGNFTQHAISTILGHLHIAAEGASREFLRCHLDNEQRVSLARHFAALRLGNALPILDVSIGICAISFELDDQGNAWWRYCTGYRKFVSYDCLLHEDRLDENIVWDYHIDEPNLWEWGTDPREIVSQMFIYADRAQLRAKDEYKRMLRHRARAIRQYASGT